MIIKRKTRARHKALIDEFSLLDSAAKIATVGAFIFTGVTFWILFARTRKSEQVRIAGETSRNLKEIENRVLEFPEQPAYESQRKYGYIQYLNEWEFFSMLVNTKEITNEHILEFFKPDLLKNYETIFGRYKDLEEDQDAYQNLKQLYRKWKHDG